MGLDVSHECWHGSYTAFSEWRNRLAQLAGYELKPYSEAGLSFMVPSIPIETNDENWLGMWATRPEDALLILLAHSDCDGIIMPLDAGALKNRLVELLESDMDEVTKMYTVRFIDGLDEACESDEIIRFG